MSDKAALTPKECTIGNESWTENQFQQETGRSLLKLSCKIYHCNNAEHCGQEPRPHLLHSSGAGRKEGPEKPGEGAHSIAITVHCHFNEILIHLCLYQCKDDGCVVGGT